MTNRTQSKLNTLIIIGITTFVSTMTILLNVVIK